MRKLINQYKKEGEWKIQLIAEINFISLKPVQMKRVLCTQEVIMRNL